MTDTITEIEQLAADTLRGDVRDAIIAWFKANPEGWGALNEEGQRNLAASADNFATQLVKQMAQIIAAGERPTIVATLSEYKEKDGIEAKLKLASRGEIVAALHEACGREVLLVATGDEAFQGEAGPADVDADQPTLPIDED